VALSLLGFAAPLPARAQTPGSAPGQAGLTQVFGSRKPPDGRERTAAQVLRSARRAPKLRAVLARHPHAVARVYLRDHRRWQVSFYAGTREIAQAIVADRSGRVLEAWTGIQVAWMMARGYPGAFGGKADALYIWLPLLALFLLPFLRPPWRLLHLDLAVLAAFSVSVACFNRGDIGASVPLAYPPLVYLLLRLLAIARRRARPGEDAERPPLRLLVSPRRLGIAAVFLLGFRVGMQIVTSNVIDVGYAGVIGADHISHGAVLYGAFPVDNLHGDTYGPLNYLAYVPFELIWPWSGTWDDLPAAHAATATFDLACVGLLYIIGRRLRGPGLATVLAYLWLACPLTLMAANSGTNDPLVGALVLAALAAVASPAGRGAAIAAAGMVKFAPLALLPLFVGHRSRPLRTAGTAGVVLAAALAGVLLLDGSLRGFAHQTFGFQADRASPFSVWGLYDLPGPQRLVQLAAVALAIAVGFVPRRRDLVSTAALAGAVLLALQLGLSHWFYLYLVWVIGPLLIALLGPYADPGSGRSTGSIEVARPASSQRITTALSHGSSDAAS
jgi:hypothetical protein